MLRNDFEKKISRQLKKRKIPFENETERIPYTLTGVYIPDFILHLRVARSGDDSRTEVKKIYIECKGFLRREDKRKLVAVKKQHSELDLRIVFYRLDKQNIKWAEKHKIRWSVGTIPNEWFRPEGRRSQDLSTSCRDSAEIHQGGGQERLAL